MTRLALAGEKILNRVFRDQVRQTSVFAKSEFLPLAERPVLDPVTGAMIPVAVSADGLLPGRRLLVRGRRASDKKAVNARPRWSPHMRDQAGPLRAGNTHPSPTCSSATGWWCTPTSPSRRTARRSRRSSARARRRGVPALRAEALPLTYRSAANETGADSELTVRVGDVEWAERPTLFGAAPTERAYTLDRRAGQDLGGVRRRRARRAAAERRRTTSAPRYRQGLGSDGNVARRQADAADDAAARLEERQQPAAGAGRHRPRAGRRRRGSTMPLGDAHAGPRGVAARLRGLRAARSPASPRRRRRCCSCRPGRRSRSPWPGQDGARCPPANPVWNNLLARAEGERRSARRTSRCCPIRPSTFRLGLKVKRDPAYEIEAGARGGGGGVARALLVRCARARRNRCSSRT